MGISRRVTTESGTVYEFDDEQKRVRRVVQGDALDMRRDGDWLQLFITNVAIPGVGMTMFLEHLAEDKVKKPFTVRHTTPVKTVEIVATLGVGEFVHPSKEVTKCGRVWLEKLS